MKVKKYIVEMTEMKNKVQKCNATILLSLHGKPAISNVCGYRLLNSFTVLDSFRGRESHNFTTTPVFFFKSVPLVL